MKSRVVPFLQPEIFPYASVEIIRAAPVTTKLHLSAREMIACSELLARGWTLLRALESIQCQRAFLASLATPAAPPIVCSWCPTFDPTRDTGGQSHGICASCQAQFLPGVA